MERAQWASFAQRCTELHTRWYRNDQLHEPRPQLFDYWRPICSSAGMPLEAGLISWHELEIGVSWFDSTVDLRVLIPDGTRVTVTDQAGPWNAVARDALIQLQQMAAQLVGQLPESVGSPSLAAEPAQRAARQRLKLAQKIMLRRLP